MSKNRILLSLVIILRGLILPASLPAQQKPTKREASTCGAAVVPFSLRQRGLLALSG